MNKKRGRLSNEDKSTIHEMKEANKSEEDIAKKINRTVSLVLKELATKNNRMHAPKAKDKTHYARNKKGATIMTEVESMRSDDAKMSRRKPNKLSPNIHKINE